MHIRGIGGELRLSLIHRTPSQSPEAPDLHIRCSAKNAHFAVEGASAWLEWPDIRAFIAELERLNETLSGKAEVFSMSPSDFALTVTNLDSKGHMAISFTLGSRVHTDNGQFESRVTGGFEVLPSEVEALLSWFKALVAGEHERANDA